MRKIILDANAILRYVMDDIKQQADTVERVLKNNSVLLLPEVMAEVIYVLTKYYKLPRDMAIKNLLLFLSDADYDIGILADALKLFSSNNFDFVDCLLYEYSKNPDYTVFTFDKNLQKLIGADYIHYT
jgi:predicted nucleic-acid-binding protein